MDREKINQLIAKALLGTLTTEEQHKLNTWEQSFNDTQVKVEGTSPEEKREVKDRMFKHITASTQQKIVQPKVLASKNVSRVRFYPTAAVIALLVAATAILLYFTQNSLFHETLVYKQIVVPQGKTATLTLADGSKVWLNAGSRLKYPLKFGKNNRNIYLDGEGFFEVVSKPDKPFRVYSHQILTQVLGTSFNVNAYGPDSTIRVTVQTGKVSVQTDDRATGEGSPSKVLLVANQQAFYNARTKQISRDSIFYPSDYTAWRDGKLVFRATPMDEVLKVLSRKYNIKIGVREQAILQCKVYGEFGNLPLQSMLQLLCMTTETTYQINGKEVTLKGKGCKP
jgi:ferric-dicitrate binding protein FerR (iron transport regulator)